MEKQAFTEKRILVLGLGISGRSAAKFLIAHGACVVGVDRDIHKLVDLLEIQSLVKLGLNIFKECEIQNLAGFDFLVISPGIPLSHFLAQAAQRAKVPIMGEIELGCRTAKNPMIGITGTNGKTTVALLVAHVLQHCSQPAKALGNVGIPLTSELLSMDSHKTIVLELSSYQIETFYQSCLEVGVILNITPDHLDRYQTMEAYA